MAGKDGVTKWFTSVNGFNIEVEGSEVLMKSAIVHLSSYDEYDEGLEDDVFKFAFRNKINIKKY